MLSPDEASNSGSLVKFDGHQTTCVSSNSADKQLNSLKESLDYFGMLERLEDLENSLENVKRKNEDKKDHEQLLRKIIKELQKKSKIFHPDKTINRGESPDAVEDAQNVQSALNATITILRTLTENFLEDTDIDFKYEYFADLEIYVLASDHEIKLQIENVLCKISELSEIKRMSIIGQIRKFLSQSQVGFKSFSKGDKEKFMKHIGGAFFHLKKCIDGYKSLIFEYSLLEKECTDEGDENMRSVIKKLAAQSSKELKQLEKLETAKKKSHYNFEIFQIEKNMDEYFILPFVYHVNVLLMCHVMLGGSSSHRYAFLSYLPFLCMNANHDTDLENFLINPDLENFPGFTEAYELMECYKKEYRSIEREKTKKRFDEVFEEIVKFLHERFKTETYIEGKSNKAKIAEEFLKLKNEVENFNAEKHRLSKNIITGKNEDEPSGNIYNESSEISVESEKETKDFDLTQNRETNKLPTDCKQKCPRRKECKNGLRETNAVERNTYACNNSSSENNYIRSDYDEDKERPLESNSPFAFNQLESIV